jgi:hypothetical protein
MWPPRLRCNARRPSVARSPDFGRSAVPRGLRLAPGRAPPRSSAATGTPQPSSPVVCVNPERSFKTLSDDPISQVKCPREESSLRQRFGTRVIAPLEPRLAATLMPVGLDSLGESSGRRTEAHRTSPQRDSGPEVVGCRLVGRVDPRFGDLATPYVEDLNRLIVERLAATLCDDPH